MADDVDDHTKAFECNLDLIEIIQKIIDSNYLARMTRSGVTPPKNITWAVAGKQPLALICQDAATAIPLVPLSAAVTNQNLDAGVLRLHCSYLGVVDPTEAKQILGRFSPAKNWL